MTTALDRMRLSLLVEPADIRLGILLRDHDPAELVRAIVRGSAGVPAAWRERSAGLESRLEAARRRADEVGLRWIVPGTRHWPQGFDHLAHVPAAHQAGGSPVGVWVRGGGQLAALTEHSVAVVGARDCTAYGSEVASELAADVVDAGGTVVSGAAFGIDAAAHRGALALGGHSIAVLACGADLDYPKANAALLSRIAEDGLVVSEQPPGQPPTKSRFLSRNRLIAALAGGTVVVEAAIRSGSLNTLRWSDALGRASMAVPGPVGSQQSAGCHRAVRDGKAVLVTDGRDVLAELAGPGVRAEPEAGGPATEFDRLPEPARRVLDALTWDVVLADGEAAERAGVARREARSVLALLHRRGLATRAAGGWLLARRADL